MDHNIKDPHPSKREALNIRIKPEDRRLIDQGALAVGKNRTEFILDAARLAAEEAILEQTIRLDFESYQAFLNRLDDPPAPGTHLKKSMQTCAPWDT
ncbi:DUF1778 domain-containing protein [Castellaniella sp.]|uniref:type II toxin-antitoxin system TacA family antitoxin n=1 Tax=Castellaniella sp. TaxID=1955812 RepID=UPI00355FFD9D